MARDDRSSTLLTERIKALTDGVLAIVLTILVLSFEVPEHDFEESGLMPFLLGLLEPFVAYVVTFGIVSAYWMQHAALMHFIKRGTRSLFWLNLLLLLPISLLPFLTELRAIYHNEYTVTLLYAGANVLGSLLLLAIWVYSIRAGLTGDVAPDIDRSMRRRILWGVALNILGAALAPIDIHLSSIVFLMVPVLYLSHRAVDSSWGRTGSEAT